MNIYVGNLAWKTRQKELRELFENFGEVTNAFIVRDKNTRRSRGFGFVEMAEESEALVAIEKLNNTVFLDRTIVVNEAHPKDDDNDDEQTGDDIGDEKTGDEQTGDDIGDEQTGEKKSGGEITGDEQTGDDGNGEKANGDDKPVDSDESDDSVGSDDSVDPVDPDDSGKKPAKGD